jgi:hypothetical protein
MITVQPSRRVADCVLVASTASNRTDARREVAAWATARQLFLPKKPRTLSLVNGNTTLSEWFVLENKSDFDPQPPQVARRAA